MRKKKRNVLQYLRFSNIKTEISAYGYSYSFRKYMLTLAACFAVIFIAGKFFHLQMKYTIALMLAFLLVFPVIVLDQFRYLYEQNRFQDVVNYLEQMIYSFKKTPKILLALQDTKSLCTGRMKEVVEEAITRLNHAEEGEDRNVVALDCIEQEYQCNRIKMLHDFLKKVEKEGGQYQNTLNVILDDVKEWTERTYLFQKERAGMKVKIILSLCASLFIAGATILLLASDSTLVKTLSIVGYQIETFILLLLFLLIFMLAQKILTGSWLKVRKEENVKQIDKDWNTIRYSGDRKKKDSIKSMIVALLCVPVLYLGITQKDLKVVTAGIILMVLALLLPGRKQKQARKRIKKEINEKFPYWIRGIGLRLQSENVYAAIRHSLTDVPYVLKKSVEDLVNDIDQTPDSVLPYQRFLPEFDLPEIKSVTNMLYSLTSYGTDDSEEQINTLIRRNNALMDKAERIQNENEVAGIGILTLVPMLFATLKMIIDLGLVMVSFFSAIPK